MFAIETGAIEEVIADFMVETKLRWFANKAYFLGSGSAVVIHLAEYEPVSCTRWLLLPTKDTKRYDLAATHEIWSHPWMFHLDTLLQEALATAYLEYGAGEYNRIREYWVPLLEGAALAHVKLDFPHLFPLARQIEQAKNPATVMIAENLLSILDSVTKLLTTGRDRLASLPKPLQTAMALMERKARTAPAVLFKKDSRTLSYGIEFLCEMLSSLHYQGNSFASPRLLMSLGDTLQETLAGDPPDLAEEIWHAEYGQRTILLHRMTYLLAMCDRLLRSEDAGYCVPAICANLARIERHSLVALVKEAQELDPAVRVLDGRWVQHVDRSTAEYYLKTCPGQPTQAESGDCFNYIRDLCFDRMMRRLANTEYREWSGGSKHEIIRLENRIIVSLVADFANEVTKMHRRYVTWKRTRRAGRSVFYWYFEALDRLRNPSNWTRASEFWRPTYDRALTFLDEFEEPAFRNCLADGVHEFFELSQAARQLAMHVKEVTVEPLKHIPETRRSFIDKHYLWELSAFEELYGS
jgi:hypothetical protein